MRRLLLDPTCIAFSRDPSFTHAKRPNTTTCLMHPYFWDSGQRLGFLQDASDRFEIMCRDPRDPHLIVLENNAIDVVGPDWAARLDRIFVENLGKFRKYDGRSVQDLLRALRNKVRLWPQPTSPPSFPLSPTSPAADTVCPSVFLRSETSLSRLARKCQAPRWLYARRIPLVLYTPLPSPVPPRAHCHRQLIPPPRVHVSVVL